MIANRHILLACRLEESHLGRIARGIGDYGRQHGGWTFGFSPERSGASLLEMRHWAADGIIASLNTHREARLARERGLPVVNLSGWLRDPGPPRVMVDQQAVGRMGAEHLLGCGFRRFAYYGLQGVWFSQQRGQGFRQTVESEGGECSTLETPSRPGRRGSLRTWHEPLEQWLRTLVPPVGLMASSDLRAAIVVDACQRLGLRVPDDVAVIGVDNNLVTCEFCQTPLSSIVRDDYREGWEAAALLDRLIDGEPPPKVDLLIPPAGVVQRRSTEVMAVRDCHVAAAVEYIRQHVDESFGVERLVRVVPLSRRWLTDRFRQCLGVTPHEFICRTRVDRAKQLLERQPAIPLHQIAVQCGFTDARHFRLVFERLTGVTPAAFRRARRG